MEHITFTCRVITPMFLAGADGKTPELRAPSIKGAMRFWWRALHGHLPLKELKEREAEIFGGSGDKVSRSSFNLVVQPVQDKVAYSELTWKDIGCEKKVSGRTGKPYIDSRNADKKGIAYLFYSTWLDAEDIRGAIEPNSEFTLKVSLRNLNKLDDILLAIKALICFGGIGTRNRRGAGSLSVVDLSCTEGLKFKEAELSEFFLSELKTSEDAIDKVKGAFHSHLKQGNAEYSQLGGGKMYLFQPKRDWVAALEEIGIAFLNYRKAVQHKITETPNFGFPIVHRSSGNTVMQAGKDLFPFKKEHMLERRASPLVFKVLADQKGIFFPVLIHFSGKLIPNGYKIMDKRGSNRLAPDSQLLENFLENCSSKRGVDVFAF